MRRSNIATVSLIALATLASIAPAAHAESHNPADYPLRVHVFGRSQTTFYHNRQAEEAKGEGRANLFEGGEAKGVDFQYECDHKLQTSSGFETYPAKWKKPGMELVILQPEFGKPGSFDTCHLKVMMKDFTYMMRNGNLAMEPTPVYKEWMTKHEYDPEHGKNMPIANMPAAQGVAPQPPAAPPQ
ncbi:hypothetical protein [Terriglobus roseus]|uniref:Uncharacterized protein n=1 Tax=Terriglobus roseus TaxID=392734 RepID=A0A1H4LZH2_9BACT|nr:hypothetical protein [Terriglobus roseus]SEB75988.1 hypothetical protein SAMN05443244_1764 [Terriglobus roseus]